MSRIFEEEEEDEEDEEDEEEESNSENSKDFGKLRWHNNSKIS